MPLYHLHQSPVIGIWKIAETWQAMLEMFQNKTLYAEEALKMKSDKRKCEWLAIRLLLKHLTGTEMIVGYRDNGSPFLINSRYHISISHTKDYAALILSENPDPGIDIERQSERAWKLREKFMNEKELKQFALLFAKAPPDKEIIARQATLATIYWCAKETAYKALQSKEVDFIEHLHIAPFTASDKGIICLKETKTPIQMSYHMHYHLFDDFVLTYL